MKRYFQILLLGSLITGMGACDKKDTTTPVNDPSFIEGFDKLSDAVARGWVIKNNTRPLGTISWEQGSYYIAQAPTFDSKLGGTNYPYLGGFGGANPSYSGADFVMTTSECGSGAAQCSNWLISPEVMIKNGDVVSFYTRTYDNPAVGADRIEVRVNTVNGTADVGRDPESVGNFNAVILDVNPDYLLEGDGSYPAEWTKYTATVSGLPSTAARKSRVAIRYYVPDGGPLGTNGLGVGIDQFQFISVTR